MVQRAAELGERQVGGRGCWSYSKRVTDYSLKNLNLIYFIPKVIDYFSTLGNRKLKEELLCIETNFITVQIFGNF